VGKYSLTRPLSNYVSCCPIDCQLVIYSVHPVAFQQQSDSRTFSTIGLKQSRQPMASSTPLFLTPTGILICENFTILLGKNPKQRLPVCICMSLLAVPRSFIQLRCYPSALDPCHLTLLWNQRIHWHCTVHSHRVRMCHHLTRVFSILATSSLNPASYAKGTFFVMRRP